MTSRPPRTRLLPPTNGNPHTGREFEVPCPWAPPWHALKGTTFVRSSKRPVRGPLRRSPALFFLSFFLSFFFLSGGSLSLSVCRRCTHTQQCRPAKRGCHDPRMTGGGRRCTCALRARPTETHPRTTKGRGAHRTPERRHHTTSPEHQPTPHTHPPPARVATVDAAARSRAPRSPQKPRRGGTRVRRGRGGATAPVLVGWPRSSSLYSGGIGVATACRSLETGYVNHIAIRKS